MHERFILTCVFDAHVGSTYFVCWLYMFPWKDEQKIIWDLLSDKVPWHEPVLILAVFNCILSFT